MYGYDVQFTAAAVAIAFGMIVFAWVAEWIANKWGGRD
jgi:dipeptide/tripeptide permease